MRPVIRPAGAALLLLAGALLAGAPAGARVIQAEPPPAAERGGQPVPAAGASRPRCAAPMVVEVVCALAAPFALGAFAWWPQAEEVARLAAATRLQLEAQRPAWHAARLAAKRAAAERQRREQPHRH